MMAGGVVSRAVGVCVILVGLVASSPAVAQDRPADPVVDQETLYNAGFKRMFGLTETFSPTPSRLPGPSGSDTRSSDTPVCACAVAAASSIAHVANNTVFLLI